MRKPHIFIELAKNRGARTLAAIAVFLLVMQPFAFAMDQIVNKYPSDSTVATQDIGNSHLLDIGSVFNFNNAKSPSVICLKPAEPGYPQAGCTDNLSLSEVDESNCDPEATEFTFDSGADGWEGIRPPLQTPPATENVNLKYLYDATNTAIEANVTKKNQTVPFVYEKKFFYECGTPGMSDFKIRYRLRSNTGMNTTTGTNYLKVELINPLGVVTTLVAQTNVISADMATGWIWKPGPADTNTFVIPTTSWSESGVYKIRISGQLRTTNTGTGHLVALQFDDIVLRKTSLWTDYKHDVEYFVKAAPYSQLGGAGGGYTLEIKAAKKTSGADNANVLVYNGATWTNKGVISQTYNETLPQNNLQQLSIPLSDAEYNNGLVRVRYVDATQSGDPTPGGLFIDYQRIKVDQGICVQEVRAIEADCGKCHNYGGDVTKPWPLQGMHNKHAQTESVSDCAWCHPDVTVGGTVFPSDHMNGVQDGRAIEIAGTKIYRLGGANPNGDANSGTWDPATGQCTLSECHNDRLTPAWTATYGATNGDLNGNTVIARNCSRCHNTGVNNSAPAADDVNNLNITAAWPDTLAHREHDNAFNMDENSCQANGSCHPDNRVQHTPVDDTAGVSTLMSPKYQSPSGSGVKYLKATTAVGDGRCYNATCHGGQETPKWNATVGSLDPSQPNSAYCKACHKGEKATTWTPGAVLPDISAKQYNSPISGLHQGSPPTSGKSHVSEYGCAVCHTINPSLHFKDGVGNTNLDTWQMDPVTSSDLVATMGYAAGTGASPSYTSGTPPTCATPYPGPGGLACHAESDTVSVVGKLAGTGTPWARDWSWDSYSANPADRCEVCHGMYGTFKTGMRSVHTGKNLAGNHSDSGTNCGTMCHGQTDNSTADATPSAVYNHGVSLTAEAKTIDVSTAAGYVNYPLAETSSGTGTTYTPQVYFNQAAAENVGCSGCHDNGQTVPRFQMQESGWKLRNQITGPTPTCYTCHGDSANRYWPVNAGNLRDGTQASFNDAGKHQTHMARLAAKLGYTLATVSDAQQRTMCAYCHVVQDSDHMTLGGGAVAEAFPTSGKKTLWNTTDSDATFNGTNYNCTNLDCHNSKDTTTTYSWYSASTSACVMCHTPGGVSNDPTSGLHKNSPAPTTSTVAHDDNFASGGTCTTCHTAMPVWGTTSLHVNGTFTANEATATNEYYTFAAYTDAAANAGTCAGTSAPPNGVNTGCHSSTGDAGTWARKWSVDAYLNTGDATLAASECNVCHGTFAGTWRFGSTHNATDGSTEHGYNWDGDANTTEIATSHNACKTCHNYGDASYVWGTHHRTGSITMNSQASVNFNQTNWGCDGGTCHANNWTGGTYPTGTGHRMDDSGWAMQLVAGPSASCSSCHGDGTPGTNANNYWPDGASGSDEAGRHLKHVTELALKLFGENITTLLTSNGNGTADAKQKKVCAYCHEDPAGANFASGSALHNNGTANVAGYLHPLWQTYAADFATTDANAAYTVRPTDSCTTVDCHNNKTASGATFGWYGSSSNTCTLCHTPGGAANDPTSGLHTGTLTVSGVNHDDSFASGGTCTTCHTQVPARTQTSAHINGTFTANEATATNEYYTLAAYTDAAANSGTCSGTSAPPNGVNTGCHSIDPIDGGTWARKWSTTAKNSDGTECANCHGGFAETDWTFGMNTVTNDYNVSHNHDWDGDLATGEVIGNHKDTAAAANTVKCNICHVYADSPYTTVAFTTYHRNRLITMNSTMGYDTTTAALGGCTTTCHQSPANHTMERSSSANFATRAQSATGPVLACGACHTGGVMTSSETGAHDKHGANFPPTAPGTACIPCHGNNSGANYAVTTGGTHGNGSVTWQTNLTYSAARGVLTGTCTGTAGCHVQTTNIAWNVAPSNCDQCHSSTTDTNNFGWTGTAGNISKVSSTEFSAVGHGSAANGAKTCLNCHDIAVVHDTTATLTGTNPYRLIDQDTGTGGLQFSCSYNNAACHLSATATNEAALGMTYGAIKNHERANFTAPGVETWGFTPKCVDCHDPHGDGSNVKMIQKDLWDNGSGATMVPTDYGTIGNTNLTFTANTTGQDTTGNAYADTDTPWSSICQECHETADVDFTSYKDGVNSNIAPHPTSPGDCSGCHKHSGGFKPEGCAGCHGGANATWSNKNMWPDLAAGSYPKRAGMHQTHINRLMTKLGFSIATITDDQQKQMCTYCHGALATIGATLHDTDNAPVTIADVTGILRIWNASADATGTAAAFSNDANATCSGIDCHNNQATGATFNWRTGTASTCAMCHTTGGTNSATTAHPSSGIHDVARITGRLHDNGFTYGTGGASTADCITCHTTTPTTTSGHMNGTNDYSIGATDAADPKVFLAASVGFTDAVVPTCAPTQANGCHIEQWNAVTDHTWTRLWHENAGDNTGAECKGCHGTFTQAWRTGTSPNHAADFDTNNGAELRLNHDHGAGSETEYNQCISCHVYNDALYGTLGWNPTAVNKHGNGQIEMITGMGYATASNTCATNCHDATGGSHAMTPDSGWTVANLAGPAMTCTGCHTGSGGGAKNVGPTSTHVKTTVAGSFTACTTCHNNHTGAAVGGIIIPNNTTVGINYVTTGHSGIQLGGTGTDASISALTSEAAMCWACHALPANLISEWGANTDPSTGNSTYNYGSVTTPDWTTATWSSSRTQYAYKSGAIQSTHTANPTVTDAALGGAAYSRTETKNTAAQIRCSNCHDVHDLGLATGDKKEGKPYLRGSWMGNPYEEDGAPRAVYANTTYFATTANFGQVPRGDKTTIYGKLGGYWIDQNNVIPMTATTTAGTARLNPTSTWEPLDTNAEVGNATATSPAFAGLCLLCHGTGATTALKIDGLDQVPSEAIWMGTNGHANSVKGGTGATSANSFNVFTARGGVTTYSNNPQQHYNGMVEPADVGTWGFRTANSSGLKYQPPLAASATQPKQYLNDFWVVDETGATKENQYHKFSCSKCHNPHASRLPKLMITNCLDTVHNTWDNQFQMVTAASTLNNNREMAQWTSAQNCHRYSENTNATAASPEFRTGRLASPAGSGAGWNKVTPWMSTSTTP